MNAFQAPSAPSARRRSDQPAAPPDAQQDVTPKQGAEASAQPATPTAPPQEPRVTAEDISGWAMGGSD